MKLLIDTKCYTSIIRPSIAEKYYSLCIYQESCSIKTATGQKKLKYKAFKEIKTDKPINCLL